MVIFITYTVNKISHKLKVINKNSDWHTSAMNENVIDMQMIALRALDEIRRVVPTFAAIVYA